MQVLGIESSSLVASVALWKDDVIVAEYTVNYKKTHSQTLLPMLDEIVRMTQTDLKEIDAIALSNGPGSFTGLRIGSATAKGLGLALCKPIVEVGTVEATAYQCFGYNGLICPIMDARRSQVYTGLYRYDARGAFSEVFGQCALGVEELVAKLVEYPEQVLLLGDGVPAYKEKIEELAPGRFVYAPAFTARQRAAAVAALGAVRFKEGRAIAAEASAPDYLRKSQAEREMEEKEQQA